MVENNLKIDFDAFLRSFKQNKDGSFAFLLGAGASITSGIQSAEDCVWDWKKRIYISNNPSCESFLDIHTDCCKKNIQMWLDEQGIYPKEGSQEEYVFYAEKTFPLLMIEQNILKIFASIKRLILVINFCAFCINMVS